MIRRRRANRCRAAFSATELSAVLASAAVLVAVAVPSASRLGGHARTTLCLSNIRHMATAFLAYAEDYDKVFPFVSTMHHYVGGDIPDPNEIWLADWQGCPDPLLAIGQVAYQQEAGWPACPNVPGSGTLFPYVPSASVYRCPEFERIDDPSKAQGVFNYTRPFWARRWLMPVETGWQEEWGNLEGPILRVADIHKPSRLPLVLDEQWDRHVATAGVYGADEGPYNCNDYGFALHNVTGVYHGPPLPSAVHDHDYDAVGYYDPFLWKLGSVGYYDGHAGLKRDPWPTFELGNNWRWAGVEHWRFQGMGARAWDEKLGVIEYLRNVVHAQRGFDPQEQFPGIPPWG